MSFFGKQFKKVKTENSAEFLGKLKLSDQTLNLLRQTNSVTSFTKNADGNIQYVVKASDGNVVLNQVIQLGKEVDYKAPDGMDTKVKFTLEGDVLKSHMQFPDGTVVHMDRYFEANGFKMEMYVKGGTEKATVYYEVV